RHHLLMDGWCMPVVLSEVLRLYEASCEGKAARLEPARRYRDYIEWLQRQDLAAAEAYWRRTLGGYRGMGSLRGDGGPPTNGGPAQYRREMVELDEAATRELQQLCRQRQLTVNTIVQGAW